MAAAGETDTHPLMKALARAKAYVAYAQARPGMYGLMFRTERIDMTRPSLHEAATASFEGLATAVSSHPQREAYRRGAGNAVARPGRRDCADVVAGARLHHATAGWAAEGYFAPAAGGHQRRPTATRDAALDRRAAAGAIGQRFGGEFARAFSSEVETGSRQENASNQKSRAPFRFHRNGALASEWTCAADGAGGVPLSNPCRSWFAARAVRRPRCLRWAAASTRRSALWRPTGPGRHSAGRE